MEFRTRVDIPTHSSQISHSDQLMLMGSCFAENIGNMLTDAKFRCDVNPFGILYNPHSIRASLRQIMENKQYTAADLFFHDEHYRSYMHHGSFANNDPKAMLRDINHRISQAHRSLPHLNYLLLTFGTSWVYTLKENGQIVSNCHKMPANTFERTRLTVDEIVKDYTELIQDLRKLNPSCKFLFTVSPIRHAKDGAHGNQLSKAILLLAIERLQEFFTDHVVYFPSYEIVLDELRDYRFYNEDMNHPSPLALEYVWERFSESFFSRQTQTIIKECQKIKKDLLHRPINKESTAYRAFLKQIVLKINGIEEKYPNLDFEKEKERCHTLLNSLQN
ncbi:GSCFA domain-containing protein [Bacteroides sp. 51]|uniref:GSCFA domain-containing protein n=1 Tax=Bacteroides sp. 51 TaxID=2302938 RepID=UPI0013D31A44|nr:GSCFA domain-containing protein [Bacteroides sp. 51]NDV81274.1 GSCFA domain protein [Bacteroides sp. 51]